MLIDLANHLTLSAGAHLEQTKTFLMQENMLTISGKCSSLLDLLLISACLKIEDSSLASGLSLSVILLERLSVVCRSTCLFLNELQLLSKVYLDIVLVQKS